MDQAEAKQLLIQLRKESKVAADDLSDAQARVNGLRQMMDGILLLHPSLHFLDDAALGAGPVHDASPGASESIAFRKEPATKTVLRILAAEPDRWFTGRDMMGAFAKANVAGTETAIRLALKTAFTNEEADMRKDARGQEFRIRSGAVEAEGL
ncbi:MAG: hypothetical protein EPN48_15005 [Microbacteriaceae bacterium]|nr:MAG: hypothetical protein EPN48_15005 [Microbacteriaceae bacterium]